MMRVSVPKPALRVLKKSETACGCISNRWDRADRKFLCVLYDGGRRAASNSYPHTASYAARSAPVGTRDGVPLMLDILFLGGGCAFMLLMVAYEALCRRL
ncbi:hypothetical protein [Reyranella sp. CPCC 100927]|uniref:hypothetical protein n=1 Tax=Reyranella sp. CPCC 100927 TaxID=2599616 RepID=UPI0011B6FED2|nr:hypothetical protein [Reyranella sp. CPCC 100927]TWT15361.1 hypothetical protein FQU96_03120 [Reyranella sp. CPCC 100927]